MHKNTRDLTGLKFNKLTAIRPSENKIGGRFAWLFRCDCGIEKDIVGNAVSRGSTKSCGCLLCEYTDLTGKKFGKLTAISREGVDWLCLCECNNTKIVKISQLQNGAVKSCGCLRDFNLSGQTFGDLIVIELSKEKLCNRTTYKCLCTLYSTECLVMRQTLNGGTKTSCGCDSRVNKFLVI